MIGGKTGHKGFSVKEVAADVFVNALAKHFEESHIIEAPEWADLVKTGCLFQMPPTQANWWYVRAAAIARQVYLNNGVSVGSLRFHYGGNQHVHCHPDHHRECSGKVIRVILQQLEKANFVKIVEGKGRVIAPKGQKILDQIANETAKQN